MEGAEVYKPFMKTKTNKSVDFKYNLQVYWSFLRPYGFLIALLVFIVLAKEVARLTDKFLFKIIIDQGTLYATDALPRGIFITVLSTVAGAYLLTTLGKSAGNWMQIHLINKIDSSIMLDMKQRFFNHLVHLSHNFHITHKTGSLIARLGRGAGAMERMTDFIGFNIFPLILQLIVVSTTLLYFDKTTGIVITSTTIVFVAYTLYIQKLEKPANDAYNKAEDIEKANIGDILTNIDSIKYYGKESYINRKYTDLAEASRKCMIKFWDYGRWRDAGHNLILALGTFLVIITPIKQFLAGNITVGTLVLIYTAYLDLFGNIYGFSYGIRGFYRSMTDFNDLFQYGKIHNEIEDKPNAKNIHIPEGSVLFNAIDFNYGKRKLFKKFTLEIAKNEKVALVGHSGSGKSTLIKLLYRLYDVDKGSIVIDNQDIRNCRQESVRSELSIVPQECVLFDDTIYNNILFSNPSAKREDVMQAIKFAQLDRIINEFPNKEDTIVGQRGIKLSGGEKQRVSIARAILANKKILVLDEATSSLDSQTEHDIQRDLQKLLENRTSIIIAHRLSTIMRADKIVVLDKGKIVQIGAHRELIKKPGLYKQLWNLQKGGYIGE
ncbi:ABC transporter ATP-binding protein [Candidatus Pacearchaeota archaeon]|nr:ABC transporter ATP-binding protein [Candidatus Pacearchaeota archaeon]